ncbi:MAG: calcium-binding protein [Devosia sp.]
MEENEDLGAEVFLYEPGEPVNDGFTNLTEDIGPGFGDPLNKYAWSAELFDGSDPDDNPELYVGTFSTQDDVIGQLTLGVLAPSLLATGNLDLSVLANGFGTTVPDPAILDFLSRDLPNYLNSDGGEIWKYDFNGGTWTQVFGPELSGGALDDEDIGIRDLVTFKGELFAATTTNLIYNFFSGGDNQAKLFKSSTGEPGDFAEVSGGPSEVPGTSSIRALTVVTDPNDANNEILLVGTENVQNGAQLWSYDQGVGWTLLESFNGEPDGQPYATAISEIEEVGGKIYVGTWLPYKVFEVTADGVEDFTPDPQNNTVQLPSSAPDDNGVMQIIEFDGYMYVGSVNYTGGASLYRIKLTGEDPEWETITTNGFQDTVLNTYYAPGEGGNQATYVWQLSVVGDALYFGDFSDRATLGKIVHEGDDDDPMLSLVPETDNPFQFDNGLAYGIRKLEAVEIGEDGLPTPDQADPNALIIGTADPFNIRPESNILASVFQPDGNLVSAFPFNLGNTLFGTAGEDTFLGAAIGENIRAGAEDDIVFGDFFSFGFDFGLIPSGDDIRAGSGEDVVFGMGGDDTIRGGRGEDFIIGGSGRDNIRGGDGIDLISGDGLTDGRLGNIVQPLLDELLGGLGGDAEVVEGVEGPTLFEIIGLVSEGVNALREAAGGLDDLLWGNGGDDIIIAGGGDDKVRGGEGNDVLFGLTGDDTMNGQAGDDIIDGGAGNDVMRGRDGDDTFVTSLGDDRMVLGDGADRVLVSGGDPETGPTVESGDDTVRGFERGEDFIDLSALFQNPLSPLAPPIGITNFASQVGGAIEVLENGVLIDLTLIDGGPPGDTEGDASATGTIYVVGVDGLDEQDFLFDTQLLPPLGLL